jgi:uncharacterized membrane protein
MKQLLCASVLSAAFAFVGLGCARSPEGGTPGTDQTFRLSGPTLSTNIKQGDRQTVNISVNRDRDFRQTIRLSAQAPEGLNAEVGKPTVAPGEPDEVPVTISVSQNAPLGDHIVKVTGTPDTGAATTVDVRVTVERPTD